MLWIGKPSISRGHCPCVKQPDGTSFGGFFTTSWFSIHSTPISDGSSTEESYRSRGHFSRAAAPSFWCAPWRKLDAWRALMALSLANDGHRKTIEKPSKIGGKKPEKHNDTDDRRLVWSLEFCIFDDVCIVLDQVNTPRRLAAPKRDAQLDLAIYHWFPSRSLPGFFDMNFSLSLKNHGYQHIYKRSS